MNGDLVAERNARISELTQERLGIRGSDLEAKLRKAQRLLPASCEEEAMLAMASLVEHHTAEPAGKLVQLEGDGNGLWMVTLKDVERFNAQSTSDAQGNSIPPPSVLP